MKPQAFIYKVSGEIIPVYPSNGTDFSLFELQEFVHGYIEVVYLNESQYMIVNEEGKLLGLDTNDEATKIYSLNRGANDFICGDVLVTPTQYIK